ncbi:hypothetical protein ACFLVO_03475 [Chloroflexota bacterium]
MAGRVATLEVDTTAVRLMEVVDGRVVRWASLALDSTVFEGEVAPDAQTLSAAVRQLMDSSGITARDVIASVSGLYSVSRIVVMDNPSGGGNYHRGSYGGSKGCNALTSRRVIFYLAAYHQQ